MRAGVGQITARLLSVGLQAILFAIVNRRSVDVDVAALLAVFALAQIAGALSEFGLSIGQQVLLLEASDHTCVTAASLLVALIGGAVCFPMVVIASFLLNLPMNLVLVLAVWFFASKVQQVLATTAAFEGQWLRVASAELLARCIAIGSILLLPTDSVVAACAGMSLGSVVALVILWPQVGSVNFGASSRLLASKIFRASTSPGIAQTASAVHGRNDQVMLGRSIWVRDLPAYGAAFRLFEAVLAVASAASGTLIGAFAACPFDGREHFIRTRMKQAALLGLIASVGTAVVGAKALTLMLGTPSELGTTCLYLLAPAVGFGVVNGFAARFLFALDSASRLMRRQLLTVIGNLAANLLFIPGGGVVAAASTTLLFEIGGCAVAVHLLFEVLSKEVQHAVQPGATLRSATVS